MAINQFIIFLCGKPFTGKSTIAAWLADDFKLKIINADTIRKSLFENPEFKNKAVHQQQTDKVFRAMRQQMKKTSKMDTDLFLIQPIKSCNIEELI